MTAPSRFSFLQDIKTPWGPVGYIAYKRTYARKLNLEGTETEEFHDTVERILKACDEQLNVGFTSEQEREFGEYLMGLKCAVAGRFMWQLGTETVDRLGLASLQNCAAVVVNEPVRPFTWTMDMLALGCGVGFNIEREEVSKLPPVQTKVTAIRQDTNDADFIVPDSREGWVKLLGKVLKAAFYGAGDFTYSTVLIRSKGAPIKGFGGVASGPDILVEGIDKICKVLNSKVGQKLSPTDCLDIMNIIGSIIVAGNVRRSAELAIGSVEDNEYLSAKRWDRGNIPNWRAMSNNSVAVEKFEDIPQSFWDGYEGNGEPYGLINLPLARACGRLGDTNYDDKNVMIFNPCAEQGLENWETCCLAEIFLPNIESYEEMKKVATYLYRVCKHSLRLPCHNKETEDIVHRNMRMGIGVTGYLQATEEQRGWLKHVYKYLRAYDESYSQGRNWPTSKKITTVKPSGCSTPESLIFTEQGILRLDEIVDTKGEQWQEVNFTTTEGHTISKGYINGKVKTKRFTTADGFIFESSLNHKYKVNEGEWKTCEEIKEGDNLRAFFGTYTKTSEADFIRIPESHVSSTIQILQPDSTNEELGYFLGLLMSDGSTHKKGIRISFNRRDNDLIVELKRIVKNQFGLEAGIDNDHGLCVNSVQLLRWLEVNGLSKDYAHNLRVPKPIRCASVNTIKAFIAGFWRGDGGQHNPSNWSMCSVSREFAQELATLCRAVGYNVKIGNAGPGGYGRLDRWIIQSRATTPSRYQSKEFKSRFLEDGSWADPIVKIEDSEADTYDVSVDHEDHTYLMYGVQSHNTLSLLAGVTPGVHPGFSLHHIRRIRISSDSNLIPALRKAGYEIEPVRGFDGTLDHGTMVVSFPCRFPEGTVCAKDVSAIDQIKYIKRLQSEWSDNSVSCTVYYRKEELKAIREYLEENYENEIKTISFLLHNDHGFDQAPLEEIDEAGYNRMVKAITDIDAVTIKEEDVDVGEECAGGACPIK